MTIEEVQTFLESQLWAFAKTMPETPHCYILKKDIDDVDIFKAVVDYIQKIGLPNEFQDYTYTYLYVNNYKYWTMGNTVEKTTLINRALI